MPMERFGFGMEQMFIRPRYTFSTACLMPSFALRIHVHPMPCAHRRKRNSIAMPLSMVAAIRIDRILFIVSFLGHISVQIE